MSSMATLSTSARERLDGHGAAARRRRAGDIPIEPADLLGGVPNDYFGTRCLDDEGSDVEAATRREPTDFRWSPRPERREGFRGVYVGASAS
jgi:hypothetical protein